MKIKLSNPRNDSELLKIGDKIELYGGYSREHEYLKNPPAKSRTGEVINFIEKDKTLHAVVRLDEVITCEDFSSDIVILTRRYENQTWRIKDINVIGLFLVGNDYLDPNIKPRYVESHASWRLIKSE
jgi:hypothetical protein